MAGDQLNERGSDVSNERFTQGEWSVYYEYKHTFESSFVGVNIGGSIIEVGITKDSYNLKTARLISAAPDMYRALRDVADELPAQPNNHQGGYTITLTQAEVDAIRAALAKADGDNQ